MTGSTQPPVPSAWADAYSNGDFILVVTLSGYRAQVHDFDGPHHFLAPDASPEDLGAAVLDCLAHSRFVSPEHDRRLLETLSNFRAVASRWTAWWEEVRVKRGYKSKHAIFRGMKLCHVTRSRGTISVEPTSRDGRGGWSGDRIDADANVQLPEGASGSEIGASLLTALSRCLGRP